MKESPTHPKPIFDLLSGASTDDADSRELFLKGIDFRIIKKRRSD